MECQYPALIRVKAVMPVGFVTSPGRSLGMLLVVLRPSWLALLSPQV